MRCDNLLHGSHDAQIFDPKSDTLKLKVTEPSHPLHKKRSLEDYEFIVANENCHFKTSDIGTGAYGTVKKVRDIKTGKIYAMKIIDKKLMYAYSNQDNLKREVTIQKKMIHPHIIRLYTYFQDSQNVYLVLEFAENESLFRYLRAKGQLREEEAFILFLQTCLGIDYLHKKNVIHRDLKPENLLLDAEDNIKLCDFGWSIDTHNNKTETFCGTTDYMAPEILLGIPHDHRIDIWGLGILLYEMLHGSAPFKGKNDHEKSKNITENTPINYNPTLSPEVLDLIQNILRPIPSERLSLSQIFSHPWMKFHEKGLGIDIMDYISKQGEPGVKFSRSKTQRKKNKENTGALRSVERENRELKLASPVSHVKKSRLSPRPLESQNKNVIFASLGKNEEIVGDSGENEVISSVSSKGEVYSQDNGVRKPIFQVYRGDSRIKESGFYREINKIVMRQAEGNEQETPHFAMHEKKKSVTSSEFMKKETQTVRKIDYLQENMLDIQELQTECNFLSEKTEDLSANISSDKGNYSRTTQWKSVKEGYSLRKLKSAYAYDKTYTSNNNSFENSFRNLQLNNSFGSKTLTNSINYQSYLSQIGIQNQSELEIEQEKVPNLLLDLSKRNIEIEDRTQLGIKSPKNLNFLERFLKSMGCIVRDEPCVGQFKEKKPK